MPNSKQINTKRKHRKRQNKLREYRTFLRTRKEKRTN